MFKQAPVLIPALLHNTAVCAVLKPVCMSDLVLCALAVLRIVVVKYKRVGLI